jgi:transposase
LLGRRQLVPTLWVPSLEERALRELLRRRMHLVRLRTSASHRTFGLCTQWGLRISLDRLREPTAAELLERHGMPAVWRDSIAEVRDESAASITLEAGGSTVRPPPRPRYATM